MAVALEDRLAQRCGQRRFRRRQETGAEKRALGAERERRGETFPGRDPSRREDRHRSDGDDTLLTEIPDVANGSVWPGAYSRVGRNRFVERWIGREGELRARRDEVGAGMRRAYAEGDRDGAPLFYGQDAGLIDALEPAGRLVERLAAEAESILGRLAAKGAPPWR